MVKEDDMLDVELRARFDEVRLAMERVRSGRSDSEQIWLPSGETVFIRRDLSAPIGIRIQTPFAPMERRPRYRSDSELEPPIPGKRSHGPAEEASPGGSPEEAEETGGPRSATESLSPSDRRTAPGKSRSRQGEHDTLETRGYEPAEERPPGYPEDLPFLPGRGVSVSTSRSPEGTSRTRSAVWANPPDPSRTLEELKAQLRASGWSQVKISQASTYMGRTFSSSFKRGGVTRVLSLLAFGEFSQILLFERPEG